MSYVPSYNFDGHENLAAVHFFFQKHGTNDDTLVIRPRKGTGFRCVYTQNSIATRTEFDIQNNDLYAYIDRVITGMQFDEQQCDYIQIDCPGYSSVVLRLENVPAYLDTLYAQLQSLQNQWPYDVVGTKPVSERRASRLQAVAEAQPEFQAAAQAPAPAPASVWTFPSMVVGKTQVSISPWAEPEPEPEPEPETRNVTGRVTRSAARQATANM